MSVTDTVKPTYSPATSADTPIIFSFAKKLIDDYEDTTAIDYEKVLCWIEKKICNNISSYTCICLNGEKVGYLHLVPEGTQTELDDFYILPAHRRKGIGTAVLTRCISESNVPLYLYVFKKNTDAVKLYCRMGFTISEEVGKTRFIMRREVDRQDD